MVKRSLALLVGQGHAGPNIHQRLDHLWETLLGCYHKCSLAGLVFGIEL